MRETLNTVGLVLNACGVIGLFFFGMPFETRDQGASFLMLNETDEAAKTRQKLFDVLGGFALFLILAGTGLQIWANYV